MFFLRLFIGGFIVASIPVLASRVSTLVAGILMTIPVISLLGLFFTLSSAGTDAARHVAASALMALIPLTIFFLAVIYGMGKFSGNYTLLLALALWVLASCLLVACANLN